MTLDRVRPGIGQQAADVLQLPELLGEHRSSESPALVRLAVRRASEALAAADRDTLWNWGRTAGRGFILLGALRVPVAFALIAPAAARLSLARWLRGSNERWPQGTYLSVTGVGDGDRLLAPRDEPFTLEVRADLPELQPRGDRWAVPGRGEPFAIRKQPESPVVPPTVRLRERTAEGAVRDAVMAAVGPGVFRHELPPSSGSSTFELVGGDDWLGPIRVERVDRPSLQAAKLRVRDPGAAKGEFRAVDDTGQSLIFLPDTEVELTLVGSEPIARTRLDVHPGAAPTLDRVDPRTFAARWTLREATTLEIQLTSGRDRPGFQADVPVARPAQGSRAARDAPRPGGRRPRHARRHDPAHHGRHRRPGARGAPPADRADQPRRGEDRTHRGQADRAACPCPPAARRSSITRPGTTSTSRPPRRRSARSSGSRPRPRTAAPGGRRSAGRASSTCRSVSVDELFYEILIRQRAERAKFLATVEATEKQTPVLASTPSAEDYVNVLRSLHTAQPAARPDRRPDRRHAPGDEAEPGGLSQVAPPAPGRDHRPDPRAQCRAGDRAPRRAPGARRRRAQDPGRRRRSASPARRGRGEDEDHPRADVAVGELRRRRQPGRRGHQDPAEGAQGHRGRPGNAYEGGVR